MNALRILSVPLLHRGDGLGTSLLVRLAVLALGVVGWSVTSGVIKVLGIALTVYALVFVAFWFSARWQRARGMRCLAGQTCPECGIRIGAETSRMAFAGYTRACVQFVQQCPEGAFVDHAPPLDFMCPGCSSHLFYDYLDSDTLSVVGDDAMI